MKQDRASRMLDSIGVPPAARSGRKKAADMTDDALYAMGVERRDLDALAEKQRESWEQTATIGVGLGVAIWTHVAVVPFLVKHSPSALGALADHWDTISFSYEVVDLVGLENLLVGSWDIVSTTGGFLLDNPEIATFAVDALLASIDLFDAGTSIGLGLAASVGVKKAFDHFNAVEEEKLARLEPICKDIDTLHLMLRKAVPPNLIVAQSKRVPPQVVAV